jgi:four helix bundle protein
MHNYQELMVWQKAVALAAEIYGATKAFPVEEKYGITSQIRRSAVSIASNIAEGAGRGTDKDFANFISYAAGSAYELETQLLIAFKVELLSAEIHTELKRELEQIKRMLFSLRAKLKS